ncbi:hypothetical protein MRX96_059889 [Rhipicephalus microplus]
MKLLQARRDWKCSRCVMASPQVSGRTHLSTTRSEKTQKTAVEIGVSFPRILVRKCLNVQWRLQGQRFRARVGFGHGGVVVKLQVTYHRVTHYQVALVAKTQGYTMSSSLAAHQVMA